MRSADVPAVPRADPREDPLAEPLPGRHLIFAISAMALVMASIDATIVSTGLRVIQRDLHSPITWGAWTITAYNMGQVIVMPLAGKISDLYGRKKVFLGAAALFAASSLACGLSRSIYMLVAMRALQSIGGGAFMPSASGIVADQYGRDRGKAIGLFSSIFSLGSVLGPIIGGVIITYWSWRGIFLVNIPISVVLIVLGLIFLPNRGRETDATMDVRGAGMLALLLFTAMLGITELGDGVGFGSVRFLGPELIALAALIAFGRHIRRTAAPFVSPRLLVGDGFGTVNMVNIVIGTIAIGTSALLPLYAQDRYGIPTLESGTLLTSRAVGMIILTTLTAMILHRIGYRPPIAIGFGIVVLSLVLLFLQPVVLNPYGWLGVSAGITGVGLGALMPAANNATLHLAPDQVAGISGLRGMFRQAGGIVCISVVTAVAAQAHRPGLAIGISFLALGAAAIIILPLVARIPEDPAHRRMRASGAEVEVAA